MARYQLILCRIWKDPAVQRWTSHAKLLFMWLCTNESTNPAGVYPATVKTMATECGLTEEAAKAALAELCRRHDRYAPVEYDETRQLVWVVNFLKYQTTSPKILRSAWTTLRDFDGAPVVQRFFDRYPQVRRYSEKLDA